MSEEQKITILPVDVVKLSLIAIRKAADVGAYKIDDFEVVSNLNKALVQAIEAGFHPPRDPTPAPVEGDSVAGE